MIIYKITNNVNGKVYIGKTIRKLSVRIGEHRRHSKSEISKAIKDYGFDNFSVEVIDHAENLEELNAKEIKWTAYYDCMIPKGYNKCYGGDTTEGFHHRQSSKQKMSVAKSKLYRGKGNPFYGKTHSDEQKAKWSRERKGRDMSKATAASLPSIIRKVKNLDTGEVFDSIIEAARKYNIKPTHISRVCRGKRKHTGGFRWAYEE